MTDTIESLRAENERLKPIHILSLGAGVQSSTLALMAAKGIVTPMPKAAVFADVKAEPKEVYDYLDYLEKLLPFPVYRVTEKDGLTMAIERGATRKHRAAKPPLFTMSKTGSKGILSRDCTSEFKIKPLVAKAREIAGLKGKQRCKEVRVIQWIGISTDEAVRMKDSRIPWIQHRWPLIEIGFRRHDCINWIAANGYSKPPRSACVYCPYHSDAEWRRIKDNPEAWAEAVRIDNLVRAGLRGTTDELYVHKSCRPLTDVDFSTEEERGQLNMFNNECEGMCGV